MARAKKEKPVQQKALQTLNTPKFTDEQLKQFQSDDQAVRDMSLLSALNQSLPALPKDHLFKMRDRREVELAFHACFELLGGVPAMLVWANDNQGDFYKLMGRLLPEQQKVAQNTQIVINTGVERSPLADVELTTNAAHMYEDDDEDEEDDQ